MNSRVLFLVFYIKKLNSNKAPGFDAIPAELFKTDLETTTDVLACLFDDIW